MPFCTGAASDKVVVKINNAVANVFIDKGCQRTEKESTGILKFLCKQLNNTMNDVRRIADLYNLTMVEEKVDRVVYSSNTPLKKPVPPPLSDKAKLARERDIKRQQDIDQKTLTAEELKKKRVKQQIKDAEERMFTRTIKDAQFLLDLDIFGLELNKARESRGFAPVDWDVVFNEEGRRSNNIPADRKLAFIDNYYKKNNIMVVISPAGHKPSNWIIAHRIGHGLLIGDVLNKLQSIIRVFRTTVEGEIDQTISEQEFFKMVSVFKSVRKDELTDKDEYYNELLAEYITLGTVRFSDMKFKDENGDEYNLSDYYKGRLNNFFDKLITKHIGDIIWE